MAQARYDYIIAGAGAAGLSLVYHLLQTSLRHRTMLIIDKDDKNQNDRTWCFWESSVRPFEEVVLHRWQRMHFHGEAYSALLDLSPFHYKMIRSSDFYRYVKEQIAHYPTIDWVTAEVESLKERAEDVEVSTTQGTFGADWVFSSLRETPGSAPIRNHIHLLQHFKGWVIQTAEDFFNPEQATLMDFRIAQHDACRFFYVLPTSSRTALVEFTLFSPSLLPEPAYEDALKQYLRRFLSLDAYTIEHEEFGVIPMTDQPFAGQRSEHVINLGTAGGMTKPSTGYTFQRIQHDSQQLVGALLRTGRPERHPSTWHQRFSLYDSTLLHVMSRNRYPAKAIFTDIFRKNPTERVLRFLGEETNLREEILVAHSVDKPAFIRGMWQAITS